MQSLIPFIGGLAPTAAQRSTLRRHFGVMTNGHRITFEWGRVAEQILEVLPDREKYCRPDEDYRTVAGNSFPVWAALELLRAGWTVIEFQMRRRSWTKGPLLCEGAHAHTLRGTLWLSCPISIDEQEGSKT